MELIPAAGELQKIGRTDAVANQVVIHLGQLSSVFVIMFWCTYLHILPTILGIVRVDIVGKLVFCEKGGKIIFDCTPC